MTLYKENPKDSTTYLLDLINEFNKVARYKINVQKLFAILYTNSEISEREYKRKALLKSHQKILRSKLNQGDKRHTLKTTKH